MEKVYLLCTTKCKIRKISDWEKPTILDELFQFEGDNYQFCSIERYLNAKRLRMWLLYFISRFKWPQNKLYLLFFYWCPKTLWLGNLEKQGFIWYYSSRGINIHQREEESLAAVLAAGVISYKITFWAARMRQREQTGNCPWLLKPPNLFSVIYFPQRSHRSSTYPNSITYCGPSI